MARRLRVLAVSRATRIEALGRTGTIRTDGWIGLELVADEGSLGRITAVVREPPLGAVALVRVRRGLRRRLLAIPRERIERVDPGFQALFVHANEHELRRRSPPRRGLRRHRVLEAGPP